MCARRAAVPKKRKKGVSLRTVQITGEADAAAEQPEELVTSKVTEVALVPAGAPPAAGNSGSFVRVSKPYAVYQLLCFLDALADF